MTTSDKRKVYKCDHVKSNEKDPLRQNDCVIIEKDEPSFKEKVYDVFANITVEPCVFLLYNEQGYRHLIRTFFKISNVRDTVSVVLKDAPNNRRLRLCILLIAASVLIGPMYGKLSSLVGLVENLVPLIYIPLYLGVYSATMEVLPGAVYLLGSILMLPAVVVLFCLFYEHRKKLRKLKSSQINYTEAGLE
ncbi:unnamed protein product [Arctia plantaginis]|uniref:Uncharacterized protein n=1 Tax=Arctia plantaginis TaxID=874455 RepID=A0A8S1ACI9_ARCPL|nr:unnamed protein product [Arctia plantaginis]